MLTDSVAIPLHQGHMSNCVIIYTAQYQELVAHQRA